MDEPKDNQNARLEGLLRRWGAERAAAEAPVPPAPVAARPKRSLWWTVIHYASVAAAAGILVAAGVLHYAPRWHQAPRAPAAGSPAGGAELAKVRREMAQTRDALVKAEAARAEAREQLQSARTRDQEARARLAFLTRAAQIDAKAKEQLAGELAAAERKAGEARAALSLAAERLEGAEKELPALQRDREAALRELARVQGREKELAGELARVRKMYDRALASRTVRPATPAPIPPLAAAPAITPVAPSGPEASRVPGPAAAPAGAGEARAAEAGRRRVLADMQSVYFRAMAPGLAGLAARREAAKRARMLQRVREIRPLAQSAPTRELLDRLEVTFTRLALLSPARPESEKSLAKLVAEGRLIVRIDDVLAGVGEAPATRTWLLEARLILQGADRVG